MKLVFFFLFVAGLIEKASGFAYNNERSKLLRSTTTKAVECFLETSDGKELSELFDRAWRERLPLLARGVVSVPELLVDPDEVAGLAMESDVCARVVTADETYAAPVAEDIFEKLTKPPWSILVNDAEKLLPKVGDFAASFFSEDFVNSRKWLRDDVMVSASSRDGGVGPHCDSNDVILLQAAGSRRWRIEKDQLSKEKEAERHLASDFVADAEFVLKTGDFLFVPARIPHDGVALEDYSVTCSFGFRTMHDVNLLLDAFVLDGDYFDDDSSSHETVDTNDQSKLSQIASAGSNVPIAAVGVLRDSLRGALEAKLSDETKLMSLLGRLATERRDPENDQDDTCWDHTLADYLGGDLIDTTTEGETLLLEDDITIHHAAGARFARLSTNLLAVNGRTIRVPAKVIDLATTIADRRSLDLADDLRPLLTASQESQDFLKSLLQRGDLIAIRRR